MVQMYITKYLSYWVLKPNTFCKTFLPSLRQQLSGPTKRILPSNLVNKCIHVLMCIHNIVSETSPPWVVPFWQASGESLGLYSIFHFIFTSENSLKEQRTNYTPRFVHFRYHMGSIAFGSFIIAVVRLARMILAYIQSRWDPCHICCLSCCFWFLFLLSLLSSEFCFRLRGKSGAVVDFVLKVLQCCLWCFEKFLAYLNRNAYIEIGKLRTYKRDSKINRVQLYGRV